ncbi:MAG: cytochrome c-type biogenesis protein CcmH [Hyphomicrobiales bacterium]|nr:cytochrome c-type biogenesis protein CcmH [Hyphomicrobiales bacterium]
MGHLRLVCLAMLMCVASLSHAVTPEEVLSNPQQEARARALSSQFRCLVCQNESIDESDASLAKDIRTIIRKDIVAGKSDAEITRFLVARYGDFVLLKPPLDRATLLLWGAPALIVLLAALFMWQARRQQRGEPEAPPLDAAEEAALARLMRPE